MSTFTKMNAVRDLARVFYIQQVAAGSLLTSNFIFTNPTGGGEYFEIVAVNAHFDVVSTSGTVDVRVVPTATAATGGASALTGTISTASGARTYTAGSLVTSVATRTVAPGSAVSIILGGTLTGLVGLVVEVSLFPVRGRKNFTA